MSETFTYDVFVSYSNQDKAIVHPLAERLRDDGVKVWLDTWVLQPGDPISLKIQQGLEQSHVLLMCMSKAYFASDWTTLEHHTLLFRDPTNEQRRFVPLLLEDCRRPDVIAQFLHIDWRNEEDAEFKKVLQSCGFKLARATGAARSDGYGNATIVDERSASTFGKHTHDVTCLAISPDGTRAISGSWDEVLRVWDLENESLLHSLKGHNGAVEDVTISRDGKLAVSASRLRAAPR